MRNIPVYLINLDTDKDRLEFMDKQIKTLGIDYQRFPAIRGGNLPEWLIPYFDDPRSPLYPGEIGCYASHLELMRMVAGSGAPALVLEDDLDISPDLPEIVQEILNSNLEWDIIRLSSADRMPTMVSRPVAGGYDLVRYLRVPLRTGAYLINPSGCRKFLDWKIPRTRPIDHDIRRVWEMDLTTYGVSPIPVRQNVLPSSIDANGGRITKGKKHVKHTARDKWNRFVYNCREYGAIRTLTASVNG